MKNEILKKTLLYRLLAFGIGMLITTSFLFKNPFLSLWITLFCETASLILYYSYEYLWRKYIDHRNIKKGMNVLLINNGKEDKHAWYNVIEVLEDNKFVIEVV